MDQSTSSADSAPDLPTGHDLKGFPEEKAAPPPATPVPNTQKAGLEIPDTPSPYDNISVDSSPIEFLKSFNEKRVPESASTRQELGSQGFPIVEDLLNEEKHLRSIEGASIQGTYVEEGIASNASKKISDPKPHISIDGERASAVFSGTDLEHGLEGTAVNDNSHQRKPALSNGPELHDLNTAAALDIEDEENSAGIQNISSPLQAQIDTPSNSHAQDSTATGEGTSSSLTEANSLHQPENLNDTFSAESPLVNDFLPPVENSLQLAAEIDPEETEQEPLPKAPRGDMVDQRREALPLTTEQKRLLALQSRHTAVQSKLKDLELKRSALLKEFSSHLSPHILKSIPSAQSPKPKTYKPSTLAHIVAAQPGITAEDDEKIMIEAKKVIKEHIGRLHTYNEMRDVGQGLIGMIADQRGVRIVDCQEEFGVVTGD